MICAGAKRAWSESLLCPPREDHAVDRERAECEDVEHADIEPGVDREGELAAILLLTALELGDRRNAPRRGVRDHRHRVRRRCGRAEWHDCQREQCRSDRDSRGEHVKDLVDVRRDHLFLEEEFPAVGEGLKQPAGADAIGADPVLHPRGKLSLREREIRADAHHARDHSDNHNRGIGQVKRRHELT